MTGVGGRGSRRLSYPVTLPDRAKKPRNLCSIVNLDDFKLTLSRPDFAKDHVLVNGKTMAKDSIVLSHHDRICSQAAFTGRTCAATWHGAMSRWRIINHSCHRFDTHTHIYIYISIYINIYVYYYNYIATPKKMEKNPGWDRCHFLHNL